MYAAAGHCCLSLSTRRVAALAIWAVSPKIAKSVAKSDSLKAERCDTRSLPGTMDEVTLIGWWRMMIAPGYGRLFPGLRLHLPACTRGQVTSPVERRNPSPTRSALFSEEF